MHWKSGLWLTYQMKEYSNGSTTAQKQYFGLCLGRARTVIKYALGRLKTRFAFLRRPMEIILKNLPHVIDACFILHSYCEANKETR